jgi:rhamnulokinase
MIKCSIAVDIGASSGRLIAGYLENEVLKLQEIHRFENKLVRKEAFFCWEIDKLFDEIKKGVHQCRGLGLQPESIGIDTWAVDFLLLDEKDQPLTDAVSYRDPRTDGMIEEVSKLVPKETLYTKTGIQFQKFNTLYQLYSIKQNNPEILNQAKTFLMVPDYLNFLLTGMKVNEYTNATSTQLVNAQTKEWDEELIKELGLNYEMFQDIQMPKTVLGSLREELVSEFGFDMKVILPATHDTGSAVVSVPEQEDTIYISSGTWSLIGVENSEPICTPEAMNYNFTNEGGFDYRFRFLKNIMGLWMIQEVKRNYNSQYSFAELVELARQAKDYKAIINVNDDRFMKPENMIQEIIASCMASGQPVPETPGEVAKCVYDSLAASYQEAISQIEGLVGRTFKQVNVIGGGCQNELLNELIANVSNKEVHAGPVEATAIGNLSVQLMALGNIENISQARTISKHSFEMKSYLPTKKKL